MSILKTSNLRKEYSSLVAVNDVCLDIDQGQVHQAHNGGGHNNLQPFLV